MHLASYDFAYQQERNSQSELRVSGLSAIQDLSAPARSHPSFWAQVRGCVCALDYSNSGYEAVSCPLLQARKSAGASGRRGLPSRLGPSRLSPHKHSSGFLERQPRAGAGRPVQVLKRRSEIT